LSSRIFLPAQRALVAFARIIQVAVHAHRASVQWGRARKFNRSFRLTLRLKRESWGNEVWVQLAHPVEVDPLTLSAPHKRDQLIEMASCLRGPSEMRKHFAQIEATNPTWTREDTIRREQANLRLAKLDASQLSIAVSLDRAGRLRVEDGGHRLAIAQLRNAPSIRVWLTSGILLRADSPFLGRVGRAAPEEY
jgi:hypothetical protein